MKAAEDILQEFGVPCELSIVSAHRTPERMMDYARSAHKRGLQVRLCAVQDAFELLSSMRLNAVKGALV
jgi:phosphoribosylcarboxyaminoimidazole (NCAIR) mutase